VGRQERTKAKIGNDLRTRRRRDGQYRHRLESQGQDKDDDSSRNNENKNDDDNNNNNKNNIDGRFRYFSLSRIRSFSPPQRCISQSWSGQL